MRWNQVNPLRYIVSRIALIVLERAWRGETLTELYAVEMIPDPPVDGRERGTDLVKGTLAECLKALEAGAAVEGVTLMNEYSYRVERADGHHIIRVSRVQKQTS